MKKSKTNNSKTTNKSSNQVTNKKQNNVTDSKRVSDSKENIGFESKDHSFEYDENSEHSFELRDCK